jgi:hypothetical protein
MSEPPSTVDPAPAATIRVVHQLVHVPVIASPVRATPIPSTRRARIDRGPEPQRLHSRARRVLFGDGLHRPEPFPRPTKD